MKTSGTEEQIVEFVTNFSFEYLSQRTIDAAVLRIIDSLGVAVPAMDSPPVKALKAVAPVVSNGLKARLWNAGGDTTPGFAALTNGAMVRYLDMNDAYTMTSTAHPSDNIAGMLAVAEACGKKLSDIICAVTISYEIQCRFCDVAPFHQHGWDQGIIGAPAAAMGAGWILGLDATQLRDALAIAVTPNLPTYQTRKGTLSMWKGLAGPYAARAGVDAALFSLSGITGPASPIDGPFGLWRQTLGDTQQIALPRDFAGHTFAIEQSDIKFFPVRNACQLPVMLALDARPSIAMDNVSNIEIWTDGHFFGEPSQDPALWAPTTRESADHSLPFCIAAALVDGDISTATFETERYLDLDIRNVIAKTKIAFDSEFTALAPGTRSCRLIIEDQNGKSLRFERRSAPGDRHRQPPYDEVIRKVRKLAASRLSDAQSERFVSFLQDVSPELAAREMAVSFSGLVGHAA